MALTKDAEDANDLLQETMLRALSSQDKFQDGTNLKAWLYTIMKNIFINEYRKKTKRKTFVDSSDNLYYLNSSSSAIPNDAETNLSMTDLDHAFASMNPEIKIPFLMHYRGFKYQEIAEEFELPIGTIKSRIHFARKELKQKLNRHNV